VSGVAWIDKMPVFVRWISFLPSIVITYFILRILAAFSIGYAIGPESDSLTSYLFYTFYYNCICVAVSLAVSCLIVPRGRVILAFIYLGCLLVLIGMAINNFMNGAYYSEPVWKIIYESLSTTGGYVYALIMIIQNEKEIKKAPKGYSI